MSEAECRTADWRTVGFEDGARGAGLERVSRYRTACADYGVAPDLDAYRAGRDAGLRQYCRPRNAYELGRSGRGYPSMCPSELEPGFLSSYREGKRVHTAAGRVTRAEKALKQHEAELEDLKASQADAEAALIAPGVSELRRRELLDEVMSAEREIDRLAQQRAELEDAVEQARIQLRELERDSPSRD